MVKRVSKQLRSSTPYSKLEKLPDVEDITSSNLVNVLLNLEEKNITASLIMKIFGSFNGKSLCNPYDVLEVPKGIYHNNKNKFTTTAGCWVFNIYFIGCEDALFNELGYINKTINKSLFGKINQQLSYAVMEDRVTTKQLARFEEKTQMFMQFETILTPNHSEEMLTCSNKINKLKEKLYKEHQKEIDDGNIAVVEEIEKELLDYAKELLGDDPALDIFTSGAQGNFGNNFKNMFVSYGAARNPDPLAKKEYNVIKSSFMDGVSPEDYSAVANSLAAGPYSRSKKTADGGYEEKLIVQGLQHMVAGKKDSDCGSKNYVTVNLTNENLNDWIYSYIITSSGNLVELTSQNADKYIGKTVKFRFSLMCKSKDCICNRCLGNLLYRYDSDITNAGLLCSAVASKLKLIAMKAFHDSVVKTVEIDPMKAFSLK